MTIKDVIPILLVTGNIGIEDGRRLKLIGVIKKHGKWYAQAEINNGKGIGVFNLKKCLI